MRAMNACNLSYCLCGTRNISYDMVCKAMYETGLNLSHQYKEPPKAAWPGSITAAGPAGKETAPITQIRQQA